MTTRVLVTGAAGKAGRAIVTELITHGYAVRATDIAVPVRPIGVEVVRADLLHAGQVFQLVSGVDAVVHMAGIPSLTAIPPIDLFAHNTITTTNVLQVAAELGIPRVVWASSETVLGYDFVAPPEYIPIDDDHGPKPTHPYALSKVICETAAHHIAAWTGMTIVGMRFSWIMNRHDYQQIPTWQHDHAKHRRNLWGYVDDRDAAAAVRLALERPIDGSTNVLVAARDSTMQLPSRQLIAEFFPSTPVRRDLLGVQSLLDTGRAQTELGWSAQHSWRDDPALVQRADDAAWGATG